MSTMRATVFHGVDDIRVEDVKATFEYALRVLRPGGTLSSLGVYSGAGSSRWCARGRLDLRPLLTHRFRLAEINEAYELFGERRDGVMKVAITP